MRFRNIALGLGLTGASMFIYGMLVESNRLKLERRTLHLPGWPESLSGFRIALLTDFHVRGPWSIELTRRAISMAIEQKPDVIAIGGDLVDYWKSDSDAALTEALAPLAARRGDVIAVPGNHDYYCGRAERLHRSLEPLGIPLLRNQVLRHKGVSWVGLDSACWRLAMPRETIAKAMEEPAIALWHEGDAVDDLPPGCVLMLSGHSHGGQFRIPGLIRPYGHPKLGHRYLEGFYPNAKTPLYVSRGVGTTGPPSRFMCPPEVSLLVLEPG